MNFREKEDDKLLNKNGRGGVMGQKYGGGGGEPSSAQHLTISGDQSSSLTSSNKDLSSQLNKSEKYLKQMPSTVRFLFHYENLPMHCTLIFPVVKLKSLYFFDSFAQNIDCGSTLENRLSRNLLVCIIAKIRKIVHPCFTI